MGDTFHADIPGERKLHAFVPGVSAAAVSEEMPILTAPFDCTLNAVKVTPAAAVTGDDTDRKNLNVINRGAAGAGSTELGNLDLDTGTDLVKADQKDVVTSLTTSLTEGDVIVLELEKVGSGVVIPNLQVEVTISPR